MKFFQGIALGFGFAGLARAHMEMIFPPPFRSSHNPYTTNTDYSMTSPLDSNGIDYPCKNTLSLLGTDQGKSVASFAAGGQYNVTIAGGASHNGGSCQLSLSFDKGQTWRVIHSYIGNCPLTPSLDFKIPSETPGGDAVFAWTWFNKVGNREMYMNCAAVTITGSSAKDSVSALSDRPTIYLANIFGDNGCHTIEGPDVNFPYPGPDVTNTTTNSLTPICGKSSPGSGSGSDSGDNGSESSAVVSSVIASTAGPTYTQPAASSAAQTSAPGGVFITVSDPADGSSATSVPATDAPATTASESTFSTLITVTKPASSGNSAPATPTMETTAAQASPTSGSGDDTGSGDAFTAGTSCDNEGEWNCVGTTKFQRCASGQWSVLMSVAAGTKCDSGRTSALSISAINKRRRAFHRV